MTYLQNESPFSDCTQIPPFLHGLGEHETKPETIIEHLKYLKIFLPSERNAGNLQNKKKTKIIIYAYSHVEISE